MALVLTTPVGVSKWKKFVVGKGKIHKCLELVVGFAGEGDSVCGCAFHVFDDMFGGTDVAVGWIRLVLGQHGYDGA